MPYLSCLEFTDKANSRQGNKNNMNYEKVICAKCHKIIWSGGVPAMGADGDKVDDVWYHTTCTDTKQPVPEMSDEEKESGSPRGLFGPSHGSDCR